MEKPGNDHLNQVVKVNINIISNGQIRTVCHLVECSKKKCQTLLLGYFYQRMCNLNPIMKIH